ncbi:MAG: DUF5752 family protein [Acidobacteria bacterium]|jgi:hypothetical protein|nr:DUF5752 family protein [Acidobacteriota bacterium]
MMPLRERRAEAPFRFCDYEGLAMPTGQRASNLRELLEIVRNAPLEALHHHLYRSQLRQRFEAWDFPNDFASWAAIALEDRVLAEKLSALDPFAATNLEAARRALEDVMEEHLDGLTFVPWGRPGAEFHLSSGLYFALPGDREAWTPLELRHHLAEVPLNSLYYHFHEARLRGPGDDSDDFSRWIEGQFGQLPLVDAFRRIDFFFYGLAELRARLIGLLDQALVEDDG